MHLLATLPGGNADGAQAQELGQTPGEIIFLSAADSELACLAHAKREVPSVTLRLANLLRLSHPMSVDLYVESVLRHQTPPKLVIVRLLGGRSYWPYGVEQIAQACKEKNIPVAFVPGDDKADPDLAAWSTLPSEARERLWRYLRQGGPVNARECLRYAASLIGKPESWREPAALPPAGLYPPETTQDELRAGWTENQPIAALIVYRALVQSGDVAIIEDMSAALRARGLNPLPIFVSSLKDELAAATLRVLLQDFPPDIVLNATGFAVASPGKHIESPLAVSDCPVLQMILSGGDEESWRAGSFGLSARDIAMNVALPEIDGRIIGRAVAFKALRGRDAETECDIVGYIPVADRVAFTADLAAAWTRLRRKNTGDRHIALVLANYPTRDGRIGNGVELDTPASTLVVLKALQEAGYRVEAIPDDSQALMTLLLTGPTNALAARHSRIVREKLPLPDYQSFFQTLPDTVQKAVTERWGPPEHDPHFVEGELSCGDFVLSVLCFGNVAVAIQPARGYHIDPTSSYHDPALVPPHGYLAFHAWVRDIFRADATVQLGKHGNLEWLPGKSLALSRDCFPEALLGPMPHLYPFIVNDPGEGTQAKRRAQAVIVDHLTPPLTRAGAFGPLARLDQLVDEYAEASALDRRRLKPLRAEIVALLRSTGLDEDCGIAVDEPVDDALRKLDSHLCEIKETQIRDGLHIFGRSPDAERTIDLLVALARAPRGTAAAQESLLRALARDLELGFDPIDCVLGDPWLGPMPQMLGDAKGWRVIGDTIERLENLARSLVAKERTAPAAWARTHAVLNWIGQDLHPAISACGTAEIDGLLRGLDGRFVPPGPSGAPSRGRPEVLPTGRNFYSVDSRAVPTAAAWMLGWKSASLLLERHLQDHGTWPKRVALSAWGTSCMRSGGDDIAQALALIGARPTWEATTGRVTGFEILPATILDRPRVDVTLRVSGFFRDAFPSLIELFDAAVRAVAKLDEPADINPLAAEIAAEAKLLQNTGQTESEAKRRAGTRVFGSKPGAYGAGLQALIDEDGWQGRDDLANAYLAWGGYAYGGGADGAAEPDLFRARLGKVEAVIHNQDNREHDILDSDDYYQFEGGMNAAVTALSGQEPAIYHGDHARPEAPRIRTLAEEIARVVRARAANPKWIAGIMRHGYKGASEMAATLDYLFAFAATTSAVRDHHFDALFEAYLGDDSVRAFIAEANPAALSEMQARFNEAIRRGLWQPRRNDIADRLRNKN